LLTTTCTTRARGLPVGCGTVERAWKHRVSARLTLAGMIRDVPGAEAAAVVRAWRNRDRRDDALRLRPPLPAPGGSSHGSLTPHAWTLRDGV
jgi:hypothetical protein